MKKTEKIEEQNMVESIVKRNRQLKEQIRNADMLLRNRTIKTNRHEVEPNKVWATPWTYMFS